MVRRVSGLDLNDVDQFVVSGTAGEYVFEKGEAGAEMYIIHEGEVEILRSVGGETRVLTTLEPGDFFGEMSLLEKTPREVSARAVTDCKLLKIDYSTFDQMVQEDPEIAVRMLRKLARRLREQQEADLRAQQVAHQVLAKEESTEEAEAAGDEAGPGAPKASLLHPASGREFLLTSTDETTVGRIDPSTGVSPDIDFSPVDTERTLSRSHAKIVRREDGFYVCEEKPTGNGTFVNDERLRTGAPVRIENGDKISFGRVETIFKTE